MPDLEISPRLKIHYADHNPGGERNILLLHGLGATGESWLLQVPALVEAGYRVIAPDARGFGDSTFPGGKMSISEMACDLKILLDQLQIRTTDVVGISLGGVLAQQFVLDHPHRVGKLVLVNTFASLKPDDPSQFFYFLIRAVLVYTVGISRQAQVVAQRIFPHPEQEELRRHLCEQISRADPHAYRGTMRSLAGFNSLSRLKEIKAPTLVVTSQNDTTVSPQRQETLAAGIPQARRQIIPNANHAVIAEFPAEFNRVLLDFLLA